jgi:hypothetical protein
MEEYDRLPYFDIELSEYTESEYEEDEEKMNEKMPTRVKKIKKAIVSGLKRKYAKVDKQIKAIKEKMKINDLFNIVSEFKKLTEEIAKLKTEIEANGYPLNYLKILDEVKIDYVDTKPKKKPNNKDKRQYQLLKRLVNKEMQHAGEDLENLKGTDIWEKGIVEEDEEEVIKEVKVKKEFKEDEEDEEEEDIEEEKELDFNARLKLPPELRRQFWLLKKTNKNKGKKKKKKTKGPKPKIEKVKKEIQETGEFDYFYVTEKSVQDALVKCAQESTSFKEEELERQIRFFEFLLWNEKVKKEEIQYSLQMLLLKMRFQLTKTYHPMMSRSLWTKSFESIQQMLELLELKGEKLKVLNIVRDENVNYTLYDLNSFLNLYLTYLNEEWWYSIRLILPNSQEYVYRLNDLMSMLGLFKQCEDYWRSTADEAFNSFFVDNLFRQLGHYHVMTNDFILSCSEMSNLFEDTQIDQWVQQAYDFIMSNASSKDILLKTTLYYVYQLTINTDQLEHAKNVFLGISTDKLISSDPTMVAAFNRALCSLAVKLFQQGNFEDNKLLLEQILSTNNLEKLLLQYNPRKKAPTKLENPTIYMPFHMHMDIEEIIVSYLVSYVLTDSHTIFEVTLGKSKALKNSYFAKFLDRYNKVMYVNATDNSQDLIHMTIKKIMKGQISEALTALGMVKYISQESDLWTTIKERVPLECLNCYLFLIKKKSGSKFRIQSLADLFKIDKKLIKRELAKKIFEGSLKAKLDLKNDILIFDQEQTSFGSKGKEFSLMEKIRLFEKISEKLNGDTKERNQAVSFISRKFGYKDKDKGFTYDINMVLDNMGKPFK